MRSPTHVLAWGASALALACSGGSDGAKGTAQDSQDSAQFTLVVYGGGFGGASPGPGSTCDLSTQGTFEVDEAARQFSWNYCHFDLPDQYLLRVGQRTLTEAELGSAEQTLAKLEVGTPEGTCGPDAGFATLDVHDAAGTKLYISASDCPAPSSSGRTVATGIDELARTLEMLSEP